ncbi:MAG: G1 family glutamic endopeptidase, partial [Acidimicrobiales bacterium]
MYPAPTKRAFPVTPGDVISASVSYANGEFNATITDVTAGKTKTIITKASGQLRASAEWIMERPAGCDPFPTNCFLYKLADFTKTTMSESVAQVQGSPAQGLSTFKNISQIFMIQPDSKGFYTLEITGNVHTADNSFPVTWTRYGKVVPITL